VSGFETPTQGIEDILAQAIRKAVDTANGEVWKDADGVVFDLPISYTRARRWGPDKVWVEIYYRRSSFSLPAAPISQVATWVNASEYVTVLRDTTPFDSSSNTPLFKNGLPAGRIKEFSTIEDDYMNFDAAKKMKPYSWPIAVINLYANVQLAFNPYRAGIFNLINKVNSQQFQLGGFVHPPETLRFNGARAEELTPGPNQNQSSFSVTYAFTASDKFFNQRAVFPYISNRYHQNPSFIGVDLTTGDPPLGHWGTVNEPRYESAPFAGRFPGYA
jgi:hypothetical protein